MDMEIDPNLLTLARQRAFGFKTAFVPPGGSDPSAGMAPPPPGAMSPGGAPPPPMGMAPPGGAAPPAPAPAGPAAGPPMDPSAQAAMQMPLPGAMPGGAAPAAPAAGGAGAGGQKLKPEQMMQMIDMRLYNIQMQLTAVANAVQAKIDPAALVLPPGMTSAPQAEMALPGGPMDPANVNAMTGGPPPQGAPTADPAAAAAGGAPPAGDPAAAAAGDPAAAAAGPVPGKTAAVAFAETFAAAPPPPSYIGDMTDVGVEVDALQKKADSLMLLLNAAARKKVA